MVDDMQRYCEQHKALRPANGSRGRYSAGQKRCVICEIFIIIWMKCGVHAVAADSPKPKNTADRRRKGCYGFVKCFFKQVATGSCTLSVAML